MFRKSCFGHFLLILKLRFSTQIVNQLLLCQYETKKDNEMWILLKSNDLRFNKDEFVLISSLSLSLIPECHQKSLRIRDTCLKGENKVCNDELEKVFFFFLREVNKKNNNNKDKNK